jgi:outer membrane protein insertion porin family
VRPTVRSFLNPGAALLLAGVMLSSVAIAQGSAGSGPATDVPAVDGQPSNQIVELRVEGNKRVEKDAIARVLKNVPGKAFDPALTGDDIRALWALNYFSDVQLLTQRLARGIVYVIRVEERPAIRDVRLQGNEELSKDDFKETLDLKAYSILDLEAVRRNEKKIQDKYIEKGYFLSEITHRFEKVPNSTDVDVVFVIQEHAKVLVKQIGFVGNAHVTADELKAVMGTKEGSFLSIVTGEGTYREELFQRDLAVIQSAYYDRGFINVKVDKPSISLSADKRYIFITIRLDEGDQYYIGKLDFSGDLLVPKEGLRVKMGSRETEVFNRSRLAGDIQRITDVYYDQGYAYANVTPVTAVSPEKKSIDLTFEIQKGKQVYIEKI